VQFIGSTVASARKGSSQVASTLLMAHALPCPVVDSVPRNRVEPCPQSDKAAMI
jgi:hypothetical protein